jgi:hypothetical protein
MSYIEMHGSRVPGAGVRLVGARNAMFVRGEPEQRNTASDLGIKAACDLNWSDNGSGLYGDTLRVLLDLSGLEEAPTRDPGFVPRVVDKAVDCVLLTAWYGRLAHDPKHSAGVEAAFVDLRVTGEEKYRKYARTYAFAELMPKFMQYLRD